MKANDSNEQKENSISALVLRSDFVALQKMITAHLAKSVNQAEEAPNYGENDDYKQSQEHLVTAKKDKASDKKD